MTRHEDEIETFARSIYEEIAEGLDELAWMLMPYSDDLDLATLELTSRDVRLNGVVLETWLRAWHARKVPAIKTGLLNPNLKVCFKEKTVAMTRNLRKKKLQKLTPLNLGQVAECVCARNDGFRVAASRIQKNVAVPMHELQVWDVSCEMRVVGDKDQPKEWSIDVGPALFWFDELIYMPFRRRQIAAYVAKHGRSE